MTMALSGLPGVRWIDDDITIYGHTTREHNERLAACLNQLQKYNITLNKAKCIFAVDKVKFIAVKYFKTLRTLLSSLTKTVRSSSA
jgi:hypothetical protein